MPGSPRTPGHPGPCAGVMPDAETRFLLLGVFGPRSRPVRKCQRMLYWLPRLRHVDPHPLPPCLPPPGLATARLGLRRIANDPDARITVYQVGHGDGGHDRGRGDRGCGDGGTGGHGDGRMGAGDRHHHLPGGTGGWDTPGDMGGHRDAGMGGWGAAGDQHHCLPGGTWGWGTWGRGARGIRREDGVAEGSPLSPWLGRAGEPLGTRCPSEALMSVGR